MVDDLERPAQLAVLGADRVEAVRTGRDDRPLLHAVPLQGLDVARREHLEDVLVAEAAGRIARAGLLLAEHGEANARGRRDRSPRRAPPSGSARRRPPRSRPSRAPRAMSSVPVPRHLGDGRHRNGRSLVQSRRARARAAPRVAGRLHVPEGARELRREPALLEDQVAAEPDDLVDVLDQDGAGLDAGAAGHAVPDRVVGDRRVHDRDREGRGRDPSSRPYVSRTSGAVRDEVESALRVHGHVADAHDHRPRVQRLAGRVRRAGLGAAAALGAGEPVEEVLPAEVGDRAHAERAAPASRSIAGSSPPRGELAEADVEEARRDVEVLAARQVAQECRHEQRRAPTRTPRRRAGGGPDPRRAARPRGHSRRSRPHGRLSAPPRTPSPGAPCRRRRRSGPGSRARRG